MAKKIQWCFSKFGDFFEGESDILSSIFAFWHEKDAGSCIADNPWKELAKID